MQKKTEERDICLLYENFNFDFQLNTNGNFHKINFRRCFCFPTVWQTRACHAGQAV